MPKNWKTYKLGEIANIIMGQSPKGIDTNKSGIGVPLLNGPTEFSYFYLKATQFTTEVKKKSKKDDLLFCVRGSTTGRMNFSDKDYAIGRGLCSISGNEKYSTRYLKYLIDYNLNMLLNLTTGSTFPNLSKSDMNNFEVFCPKSSEANHIASILSALDDKIENNLAINKTLEDMAMALYKHWFIDFEFPVTEETHPELVSGSHRLGYKSAGGKFIDSELGLIPRVGR